MTEQSIDQSEHEERLTGQRAAESSTAVEISSEQLLDELRVTADHYANLLMSFTEHVAGISACLSEAGVETGNSAKSDSSVNLFSLNPYELDDLPESLVEDLNLTKGEKHEAQIIDLFLTAGRALSVKEVVVGMYRKFGEVHGRNNINTRLHRLAERGVLNTAPQKRGVYQLASMDNNLVSHVVENYVPLISRDLYDAKNSFRLWNEEKNWSDSKFITDKAVKFNYSNISSGDWVNKIFEKG